MKKTWKALSLVLALLLTLPLAFAFTGCSGKKYDKIVIGGIGPLTGDYANYGDAVRKGAELAVEELKDSFKNDTGLALEIYFEDSKADGEEAKKAYNTLMDKKMNVSLGCVLSGETKNVVAEAKADKIFILTPSASADKAIDGNDRAFRVCFADSAQGTLSANYIADNGLATKVAVFYQSDIDYSNGLYETFKATCATKGITIVAEQSFTTQTNTDFSTQITAIQNSGAELIFAPIYAAECSTFLTQASGKITVPVFGCDGLDGILGKLDGNEQYAEGVMLLTPFSADSEDAKVKSFVNAYKTKYNAVPDQFAADGYDAVYEIVEALKNLKVNSKSDLSPAALGEALAKEFTTLTYKGVTGETSWSADGNSNKTALAMVIEKDADGNYVTVLHKTSDK